MFNVVCIHNRMSNVVCIHNRMFNVVCIHNRMFNVVCIHNRMFNVVCIYKLIINTCIENGKYVSYSFGLSLNSHLLWIKLFKSLKDCIKLKIFASEDCFLLHTVDQYILLKKVKQCHIK